MGDVLITVMMAVYNDISILDNAISSVVNQSYGDWELLIMDNSNPEANTYEKLLAYSESDSRIRVYQSPGCETGINIGWPKASSLLLEKARGRYVFFLAADDVIDTDAFLRVSREVSRHNPDVIWVGNAYTTYENNDIVVQDTTLPEYRVFDGTDKKNEVYYVLNNVYYNSMFHYSRVEFMRENNIDYFRPYYADCASMTAVLCKSKKMVVLDEILYYLTVNTSQTSGRVDINFYNMFATQWKLLSGLYSDEEDYEYRKFVALRVLQNFNGNLTNLINGAPCRDEYMNPVEMDMTERIKLAETAMNNQYILEMSQIGA